jgi:hypothetical protein
LRKALSRMHGLKHVHCERVIGSPLAGAIDKSSKSHALPFKLIANIRFVFRVVIGITVVNIGARLLAQYPAPPPSPFSSYADIFPGQPANAIEGRGFACSTHDGDAFGSRLETYCHLFSQDNFFSLLGVLIMDNRIRQITFTMFDQTLRVGDLALFLGSAHFRTTPNLMVFSWRGKAGLASTVGVSTRFEPLRHLRSVTFTDTALPVSQCRSPQENLERCGGH